MLFCFLREEMEVVLQNQDFRSIEKMETNLQFHRNEVSEVSENWTINLIYCYWIRLSILGIIL